jgi:hypothetical protein
MKLCSIGILGAVLFSVSFAEGSDSENGQKIDCAKALIQLHELGRQCLKSRPSQDLTKAADPVIAEIASSYAADSRLTASDFKPDAPRFFRVSGEAGGALLIEGRRFGKSGVYVYVNSGTYFYPVTQWSERRENGIKKLSSLVRVDVPNKRPLYLEMIREVKMERLKPDEVISRQIGYSAYAPSRHTQIPGGEALDKQSREVFQRQIKRKLQEVSGAFSRIANTTESAQCFDADWSGKSIDACRQVVEMNDKDQKVLEAIQSKFGSLQAILPSRVGESRPVQSTSKESGAGR